MPESALHLRLRTALFLILEGELKGRAFVGSDQFVYWDPTDPKACLAPDAFVRMGGPLSLPPSFKVWEHGAPQLAVEIASASESAQHHEQKLERYRRCGIAEVVIFDPDDERVPLRFWDLIEGDLVERELDRPEALRSETLGAYLCIRTDAQLGRMLRIARDPLGTTLWPTPGELADAALARVAELERELARR